MIHPRPAAHRSNEPRRWVLAFAVLLLVVAGCSSSGEKDLTSADLSNAMPTAQELGSGYTRDKAGEADDDDDGSKLKVPAKCRALLNDDDDKSEEQAKRQFKDGQERELDVSAAVTDKTLASVEKAAKSCTKVPFTNGSSNGTISFKVTSSNDFGDDADAIDLEVALAQPISLTIKGHGILAKRGDVGISVVGFDGVDSEGNVTAIDNEMIDDAAHELDQKIKSAEG